jgi:hypothetical protein
MKTSNLKELNAIYTALLFTHQTNKFTSTSTRFLLTFGARFFFQADFTSGLCYSEQPNDDDGTSEVPDHQEYSHGRAACRQFTAADAVH